MITTLIAVVMRLWDSWDVRGMVLLSLFLQIIFFPLGNSRRYSVHRWRRRLESVSLWFATQIADLLASAALVKLCSTCPHESAPGPSYSLRGFWASSLLLHLGGPDTITAYDFPDKLLWMSHLLKLVYRAALAIYIIKLSWTKSWLSLLNIPLFFAGIIKYLEKTRCIYLASTKDSFSSRPAPLFYGTILFENIPEPNNNRGDDGEVVENDLTEEQKILLAHRWFALKRQDMANFFSNIGSVRSLREKIIIHMDDIVDLARGRTRDYWLVMAERSPVRCMFDIAKIELGFMLDMLYSKSAIIYTKAGFIARLIIFFFSLVVSVLFWNCVSIRNQPGYDWSNTDIWITRSLLVGVVFLELGGLYFVLSSDWFVVLRFTHADNRLLQIISNWTWLITPREKNRIQDSMGQFNLSRYCMSLTTRTNFLCKSLQKIIPEDKVLKFWHTSFRNIPRSLKTPECIPAILERPIRRFTRGERALENHLFADEMVIETLSMDLGATIMIWHIATDICYLGLGPNQINEAVRTCTVISDYMMYLLVIKPSMVSEDSNFWFYSFSGKLRKILEENNDILLHDGNNIYEQCAGIIRERGANLHIDVGDHAFAPYAVQLDKGIRVAEVLMRTPNMWVMMKEVWLEMMHYAAICCPHRSHLEELSQGSEILSLHWLLANTKIYIESAEDMIQELEQERRQQQEEEQQQLEDM